MTSKMFMNKPLLTTLFKALNVEGHCSRETATTAPQGNSWGQRKARTKPCSSLDEGEPRAEKPDPAVALTHAPCGQPPTHAQTSTDSAHVQGQESPELGSRRGAVNSRL